MFKTTAVISACSLLLLITPPVAQASGGQDNMSMRAQTEVTIKTEPVNVSISVSVSSETEINPNERKEEDIIKTTGITLENHSGAPVDIWFETISYAGMCGNGSGEYELIPDGPDRFASYSTDRYPDDMEATGSVIIWPLLDTEETHRTVAFALIGDDAEPMDLIPEKIFKVCTLASGFDESNAEKTMELGMKAGYAWGASHANAHKYNIVLTVSLSTKDFIEEQYRG